jgi:hypothetical protein
LAKWRSFEIGTALRTIGYDFSFHKKSNYSTVPSSKLPFMPRPPRSNLVEVW